MTDELKSCPFCNSINIIIRPFANNKPECEDCGAKINAYFDTEEEALKIWNARPIEDALRAELDALKEVTWIPAVGKYLPGGNIKDEAEMINHVEHVQILDRYGNEKIATYSCACGWDNDNVVAWRPLEAK